MPSVERPPRGLRGCTLMSSVPKPHDPAYRQVADGTSISVDIGVQPHGWFRLVLPVLVHFFRRAEKANMARIREIFERRATAKRQARA